MSTEAQAQVEKILSNVGVVFNPLYRGERANALGGETPMDAWDCVFSRGDRGESVEFDYFSGLGHRKCPELGPGPGMFGIYDNGPEPRPGTLLHQQWKALAKPQPPHPADVLQCLILDASAIGQSFESWCGDIGYDSDSRKALRIYEACQMNADKLHRFFSPEALQALQDALQDY